MWMDCLGELELEDGLDFIITVCYPECLEPQFRCWSSDVMVR